MNEKESRSKGDQEKEKKHKMDGLRQVTHIDNVRLGEDKASVVIIDQTHLPSKA